MPLTAEKTGDPSSAHEVNPKLQAALIEYLDLNDRGILVDQKQFLSDHADVADELKKAIEGLQFLAETRRQLLPINSTGSLINADLPLGDFKLIREIGRGGMGVVYEAVQRSLGRKVALKILPIVASLDSRHRQRFLTEAKAAAQIHHPNVVPIYSVDNVDGVFFYVMQLVDGQSLSVWISETKKLQNNKSGKYVRQIAEWGIQVAEALEAAHADGIIHRDIKPGNLIIDNDQKVWVTDFGLARIQGDTGLSMTGHLLGTLRYMSPEQAGGDKNSLDHRTDVYSLGVSLYELLTLSPAFADDNTIKLRQNVIESEPVRPRKLNPHIPTDLETIVLTATAKSPAERYVSAAAMAADMKRFLEGVPVLARRPGWSAYVSKWLWKRRKAVAPIITASVIGVIGTLAWSNHHIQKSLLRAEAERDRARTAVLDTIEMAQALSVVPREQKRAKEFLAKAQSLVDTFDLDDRDSESHFVLARALHRMAHARYAFGERAAADALLSRAEAVLQDLIAKNSGSSRFRRELADCYRVHHVVLGENGRMAEASRQSHIALEIYQALSAANPESGELLGHLADRHADYGRSLFYIGDRDGHNREYSEALRIYRQLVDRYPADPQAWGRLSGALGWLGRREQDAGRFEAAERFYLEGIEFDSRMCKLNPNRPQDRVYTLSPVLDLGLMLAERGEPNAAEELLRVYAEGRQRIVDVMPDHWGNVTLAAAGHIELASVLDRQLRHEQALAEWRMAFVMLERAAETKDCSEELRRYLADNLANARTPKEFRNPARARELATMATKESPQSARAWSALAFACQAGSDFPAAKAALEQALSLEALPIEYIEWRHQLVEIDLQCGNGDAARRQFAAAGEAIARWPWLAEQTKARRQALAEKIKP